jgi:hypothetical protein
MFITGTFLVMLLLRQGELVNRTRGAGMPPTTMAPARILFHGRVEDQDGKPLKGAELVVLTSRWIPNPQTPGGRALDKASEKQFSVFSGDSGTVLIIMPPGADYLRIDAVKKDGYDWVFDWVWTLPWPHNKNSNRSFSFDGNLARCPTYNPDLNRPAIFPMHAIGNRQPVRQTSRGGSDNDSDGQVRRNEPMVVNVPSAGPDAPRTSEEESRALEQYLTKMRDPATSRPVATSRAN